jgi:hypothetical protein
MIIAKQSTEIILPCLLYDVTDFITPETGIVYTAVTVYISKDDGAQTEKTLASEDWAERGNGVYDITFSTTEMDTLGPFKYQVTDGRTVFLDYNGLVMVESANISDLDTDIAENQTDLDLVLSTGSTGPWTTYNGGLGTGIYNATINVKAGGVDVENAKVTVHNASDDDSPFYGPVTTDVNGNAVFTVQGNLYVRISKAGYTFTSQAINVTATGTYNVTGTATVISPPANPETSTVYLKALDANGAVITSDLTLSCSTYSKLTKDANDNFVSNDAVSMTYDAGSETWQAELVRNTRYNLASTKLFGTDSNTAIIDYSFTVADAATTNLGPIIL